MIFHINLTNCKTVLEGETLTELIAKKDVLKVRLSAYRDVVYAASQTTHRARNSEIKILSVIDVKQLQDKADKTAKELRLLDNKIQQANWQTDLDM